MERNRKGSLPWAIALLIVVFVCVVALVAGRIISNVTHRSSYDYKAVKLSNNIGLDVVNDGFVYYDGSYIYAVTTQGKIKWSYLIGRNADFQASPNGVAAWSESSLTVIDSQNGTPSYSGALESQVLSARAGSRYTAVLLGPEYNSTIVLMIPAARCRAVRSTPTGPARRWWAPSTTMNS